MKRLASIVIAAAAVLSSCTGPKDGEYTFSILTTNDVHGHYFDRLYQSDETAPSMMSIAWAVDSVRVADGAENVILIDAGDCLHGDNAAYYFNYVDTDSEHVFARMLEYLEYDAWIPGNHDIETGHPVYDPLVEGLDVPVLAANAVHADSGEPYFGEYVTLKRHGLKITIIGFTNPNIKNVYAPELWEGMDFITMYPDFAQSVVDRVSAKEEPDVVIVAIHSGAGRGDGSQFEQQGLDLFNSLTGVDFIVSSHDHRKNVFQNESMAMVNTGNYCANLGYGRITLKVEDGKVKEKKVSGALIPLDKNKVDEDMKAAFQSDFEAVKTYTTREVGEISMDLNGRDALKGMSDYVNMLHTVCLKASDAQVSFASPQAANLSLKAGKVVYNDLFSLYSYDNQLYVVRMTGEEIRTYLEHSYDGWLKYRWGPSYNLDSAGGMVYEVDSTKPLGSRVSISSLADGSAFDPATEYMVAMNSYRARGGGDLMQKAGIDTEDVDGRILGTYKDIRTLLDEYISGNSPVDAAKVGDTALIGHWAFVPAR